MGSGPRTGPVLLSKHFHFSAVFPALDEFWNRIVYRREVGKGKWGREKEKGGDGGVQSKEEKGKINMSASEHTHKAPASFELMSVVIYS